jgi:hypothetical protein
MEDTQCLDPRVLTCSSASQDISFTLDKSWAKALMSSFDTCIESIFDAECSCC